MISFHQRALVHSTWYKWKENNLQEPPCHQSFFVSPLYLNKMSQYAEGKQIIHAKLRPMDHKLLVWIGHCTVIYLIIIFYQLDIQRCSRPQRSSHSNKWVCSKLSFLFDPKGHFYFRFGLVKGTSLLYLKARKSGVAKFNWIKQFKSNYWRH